MCYRLVRRKYSAALLTLIRECAADHLPGWGYRGLSLGDRCSKADEHADLCEAAAILCVLSLLRAHRVPAEQNACRRFLCFAAGESENPQGVVNTSEGRVVRAFHRFTLVDQSGGGRDLTKGRRRDQVGTGS